MPELPEVEFGRKLAESVAHERTIASVTCARDEIVFEGVSAARWRKALVGKRVLAIQRRGKQLWFQLDEGPHPLFHFGMTGAFHVPGHVPLELAAHPNPQAQAWPPRFTKIEVAFDDGGLLAMTNARRLGRLKLRDDPENEAPIARLGFDPLHELPGKAAFRELVTRRRTPLKALLLDQKFAAGVGNWIADEVLYQSALDPRRKGSELEEDEIERMRKALGRIVAKAVAVDADKARFPRTWLFHHRWGKVEGATTSRGEAIEHLQIGGRTTAWVPAVQR